MIIVMAAVCYQMSLDKATTAFCATPVCCLLLEEDMFLITDHFEMVHN